MIKQVLIIGLGQFGMAVATSLNEKGIEVLAIDKNEELVDSATGFGIEAVRLDATDETTLMHTIPEKMELAICTIGNESKESSIICTALLRQAGVSRIVSRSCNDIHARILKLVGAHSIVNPEKEFGQRLSSSLIYSKVISEMSLGDNIHITEIELPESFIGSNLIELELPKKYDITVIAVRDKESNVISLPDPQKVFLKDDNIVVISTSEAIAKLMKVK